MVYDALIPRFDKDGSGRIEWGNGELFIFILSQNNFTGEFLLVVALMDVTDMTLIDDFVFSTGFKVFDQVIPSPSLLQDEDGLITPMEVESVVRLFLPMSVQQTDCFVSKLVVRSPSSWMLVTKSQDVRGRGGRQGHL